MVSAKDDSRLPIIPISLRDTSLDIVVFLV